MKKLDLMHIKDDMNVLNRDEMRNIMAGCGGSSCSCTYSGSGSTCSVIFNQGSIGWSMVVNCLDGYSDTDYGTGSYSGTICGGQCP